MADKVTLINLAKVDSTVTDELNTNFTRLADAIDNAVSRDGTSPNHLTDDIDANDFQVKNLGSPTLNNHALRLADLTTDTTAKPSTNVTVEDSSGYYASDNVEGVLKELIDTNLTFSADHTFSGDLTLSGNLVFSGSPTFTSTTVSSASDSGTDAFQVDLGGNVAADKKVEVDFDSANTTTTPTLENTGGTPSGAETITTRDGSTLWANALSGPHTLQLASDSGSWLVLDPRWQLAPFWAGHIDGLELSNGTDAEHDIDITTGVCSMRDGSGNRKLFELTSGLTKQIDANWAEGTDAGGFPSGLTLSADTEYNVFLIGKDDGTVDAGFDSNVNPEAGALLGDASNYSWFRRIGSVFTDGSSNVENFTQIRDRFYFEEVRNDITDNSMSDETWETAAVSVPANQIGIFSVFINTTNSLFATVSIRPPFTAWTTQQAMVTFQQDGTNDNKDAGGHAEMAVNSSSQIDYSGNATNTGSVDTFQLWTKGWIDDRGRNA